MGHVLQSLIYNPTAFQRKAGHYRRLLGRVYLPEAGALTEVLAAEAATLGLTLSDEQLELLQLHYMELVAWNERVNLTAITAPTAAAIRHFADSLTVAAALNQQGFEQSSMVQAVDIGSGGGFPGLPLKVVYRRMQMLCVDSTGKKVAFLQHMAGLYAKRGLSGVTTLTARAEEMGQQPAYRARYQLAVARAVASLTVLAEYCLPLLKVGGVFAAPKKGEGLAAELAEARNAIKKLGGGDVAIYDCTLPVVGPDDQLTGEREERQVVLIHKLSTTPPQYPRPVGTARQRPLS